MPFDPSIISQIPDMAPNPVAAKEQGLQLAGMTLKAKEQQESYQDAQKAKNILKGVKLDSQEAVTRAAEKLSSEGLIDPAVQLMKTMQSLQSGKGDLTLQQYQIMSEKANITGGIASGLVNQFDQQIQQGVSPALAAAVMQPRYQQAIQQLSQMKLPDNSPALNQNDLALINQHAQFDPQFLRSLAQSTTKGQAALQAQMKFHQDQLKDKQEVDRENRTDQMDIRLQDQEREARIRDAQNERRIKETEREDRQKDEGRKLSIPERLDEATLDLAIKDVMADPSKMLKNYATRSAKDPKMTQINEGIAKKLKESNMSWEDLARFRQRFRSEAKSIDKLVSQRDGIQAFEGEAKANGQRALDLLNMIDVTDVPMIEGFRRSATRKSGGVNEGELASVLNSFRTQVARIIAGNPSMAGVVTDSARKEVQAIAPSDMTAEQGKRIINRLFLEMDVRSEQIDAQIEKAQDASTQIKPAVTPRPNRDAAGNIVEQPVGGLPSGFIPDSQ